ncbi:MAG: methyltransferase domain-containing protein [Parvularculaceae bacterium]
MTGEAESEWAFLAKSYARIGAPMRPTPPDVASIARLIAGHDRHVLMLGATPAYAEVGDTLTAVDNEPRMISANWAGDNARRRAVKADWLDMPFADGAFTAIIGDGSLNSVNENMPALLAEMRRVLAPGGVAAVRLFCTPETPETLDAIEHGYFDHPDLNSTAARFRIAMAMAPHEPHHVVYLEKVLDAFNRFWPDRELLAEKTGWERFDIDRFDALRGTGHRVAFPPRAAFAEAARRHFAHIDFVESAGYPLAERCPVLVLR